MRRVFIPANDDVPTQAWLDFKAHEELFRSCLALDKRLTWAIKIARNHNRDQDERAAANFIWFMKFEIVFNAKIINPRPELRVVNQEKETS